MMKFTFPNRLLLLFLGLMLPLVSFSQTRSNGTRTTWKQSPFSFNVFIENAGQFGKEEQNDVGSPILYYARKGRLHLYFTRKGLVYRYDSLYAEDKAGEESERENLRISHKFLKMAWEGANPDVSVEASGPVSNYFTYGNPNDKTGRSGITAHAWKKLVYHNLYPNIDVEYYFPDKGGIEYNIIARPGADVKQLKMAYSGNAAIGANENPIGLKIQTPFLQLNEDIPVASITDETNSKIHVGFYTDGKYVSFMVNKYDKSKTLIIDPWQHSPAFTGANKAYDMDLDLKGNVYVYGSDWPYMITKFDNAGTLLWTYTSTFAYTYAANFSFYGGMCVDGHSGSSFISEGYDGTSAHLIKINTNGIQAATNNGNSNYTEIWRMKYNSCEQKGVMLGGGVTGNTFQIADLDTTLATLNPTQIVVTGHLDFSMIAMDDAGNCITVDDANNMEKANIATFSPQIFNVPSGYSFGELGQPHYITGNGFYPGGNGFNGLATSHNFLYSYDGATLKKWNLGTGANLGNTTVFSTPFKAGGIAIDDCDDIFVGVNDSAKLYDVNLNRVNEFVLPDSVYDMRLSADHSVLYACGKGYVCTINTGLPAPVTATFTAPSNCSACDGSASAVVNCGVGPFTYNWSNGATTQTVTGLCAGNYTVEVQGANCMDDTLTFNLPGKVGYTASVTDTNPGCALSKGRITVYPTGGASPYTFSWSNGATTASDTGLVAGTYTCTITDNTGCILVVNVTLVNSVSGPTVTVSPTKDSICSGGNTTLTASGAKTYTWNPGAFIGSSYNVSPAGTTTYTVTGADSNGCTGTATVTVKVFSPPAINVLPSPDSICKGSSINLNANGASSYVWKNSAGLTCTLCSNPTASPSATTTYTVIGTDSKGCKDSTTVTVVVKPLPVPGITAAPDTICKGSSAILTGSGGGTYLWTFNGKTSDSVHVSPAGTTTYTLQVTKDGCTTDTTITVYIKLPVPVNITPNPDKACQGTQITLTANAPGATSYLWSNGATTSSITFTADSSGTYSVIVSNGCPDTASSAVTVVLPTLNVCCDTTIILGDSAHINAFGDTSYIWSPDPSSLSCYTCPDPTASPTVTTTYTVTAVNSDGCKTERTVTVEVIDCFDFTVPNVFTPNNDGINDDFVPYYYTKGVLHNGVGHPDSYSITIFDRWGKEVYSSTDPAVFWNGRIQSTQFLVPDGVYYYIIKADCGDTNYLKKGFVQVISEK